MGAVVVIDFLVILLLVVQEPSLNVFLLGGLSPGWCLVVLVAYKLDGVLP